MAGWPKSPDAGSRHAARPNKMAASRGLRLDRSRRRSTRSALHISFLAPPKDHSKRTALTAIEVIQRGLRPLLLELAKDDSGEVRARLRPRPDDYKKVFREDTVEFARSTYDTLWLAGLAIKFPSANLTDVDIFVAPAGMFASDNELSRNFPEAYRNIAHLLDPARTWAAWRFHIPHTAKGLFFDGLVWCDDR
jgi:hypothetical protein